VEGVAWRMWVNQQLNTYENSKDAITVLNSDQYIYVNKAASDLLGYDDPSDLIALNPIDLIAPEYRILINEYTENRKRGRPAPEHFIFKLVKKDGSYVTVETNVSTIEIGGETVSVAFTHDISERIEYEGKLKSILDLSEDAVFVTEGTKVRYTNNAGARLLGYQKPRELLDKDILEFTLEDEKDLVKARAIERIHSQFVSDRFTRTVINKDGEHRIIEFNLSSIIWDGQPASLSFSRDITEQKRYENRLEALHIFGSKLSKAVSFKEIAKFTLDAVESVFGFHYSDFNLIQDDYLVPCLVKDEVLRKNLELRTDGPGIIVRAYRTGESQLVHDTRLDEDYVYGRGEDTEWLSELAVPVKIGDEVVAVINLEHRELGAFNESDQKLIETLAIHVASAFESLLALETHDKVYRQMIEQKLRAEQAQELEQIKNYFIMKATHELRTPLTIIKGYSELLLEDEMNSDPATLVDFLSVILKNVKRSEILINDLLDESQLKSGHYVLSVELNDFSNLVDDVKNDAEVFLNPKNQYLSVKKPSVIQPFLYDSDRLYQVMMNLILNASKFSGSDTDIKIVVEDNQSEVKVSITDEGIGIRNEDLDRVFEPFPGIEEGTIQPGVGIGLSICKGFIELHGGEIWAESEGLEMGTTLIFTVPTNRG